MPGPDQEQQPALELAGTPAGSRRARRIDELLKRLIDLLFSFSLLSLASPVMLIIALAIKLEDGGSVFFRQRRWGRGSIQFKVTKFRTMKIEASASSEVRPAEEGDSRITGVGHRLRAYGLDELPQMFNILKGEMSVVGPRALAVGEVIQDENGQPSTYEAIPGFAERLMVRPGLTGTATIYIPKDSSPLLKFRYDLDYVRNWTVWGDVKLILLSIWISLRGSWESRADKIQ